MDERQALVALSAMSQETRLRILRRLVVAGADGIAAGSLAGLVGVSASNVSFHLKELERAGLVQSQRNARSIVYTAEYEALSGLIKFLMEDCCAGIPEICEPALALASTCCAPSDKVSA